KVHRLPQSQAAGSDAEHLLNVLFKPGVTDNVALSVRKAMADAGVDAEAVATCRKYWMQGTARPEDWQRIQSRVLANDAIEHVVAGPLRLESISVGSEYRFELKTVPLRAMDDAELSALSRVGQLYLSLVEMQTIQRHFTELER